jgi:DNA-binding MarR family transcriptional regulator
MPISYLIANLSRAISRELSRDRLPGVAVPQIAPLLLLAREPGLSNAQLARRLHVSPQSMNEVIIDLEREGLIRRRADGTNRRILRAEVTAAGNRQLSRWDETIAELEQRLFAGLSSAQVEALARSLERCVENARHAHHAR